MSKLRNIKRSKNVHGQELNRIFFEYVYESNGQSVGEMLGTFKKYNDRWFEYCSSDYKNLIMPANRDAFKEITKDIVMINKVQKALGIEESKVTFLDKVLSKMKQIV